MEFIALGTYACPECDAFKIFPGDEMLTIIFWKMNESRDWPRKRISHAQKLHMEIRLDRNAIHLQYNSMLNSIRNLKFFRFESQSAWLRVWAYMVKIKTIWPIYI